MSITGVHLMAFSTDADATRAFLRDARLAVKDVALARPPATEAFGRIAYLDVPGLGELGLYEPSHPSP